MGVASKILRALRVQLHYPPSTNCGSTTAIIPKLLIKAVCKSSTKKDACVKTFTVRNVDIDQVTTRVQLKHVILMQLRKRSKKDSESDSDKVVETVINKRKKQSRKDENSRKL